MKLTEAITLMEGLSPVLFHAVTLEKAIRMIQHQALRSDKRGHISFSRSRTNKFTENMGEDMEGHDGVIVVFEMDGRTLMANHKGRAVDSFAPSRGDFDEHTYSRDHDFDYMEDRIVLPNGQGNVAFPRNSVIAVHFIVNEGRDIKKAKSLFDKIPNRKFVYHTIRDFQQRNIADDDALEREYKVGNMMIRSADDFIELIEDIKDGMIYPNLNDLSDFKRAYNTYGKDKRVLPALRELIMAYKVNNIRISRPSELLSKADQL